MSRRSDYELRIPKWRRLHDGPMPVRTHTGAGDTIIQSGLMVELSNRYGTISVPCYDKYWDLGVSLYANHPKICLYSIPSNHPGHLCSPPDSTFDEAYRLHELDGEQEMRIGEYAGEGLWHDFIKGFYLQSGVEYRHRWDSCPVMDAVRNVYQLFMHSGWDGIFVHDDPSRGHVIARADGFRPTFTKNILEYYSILMIAKEIHVIDSAFFCLANQLPLTAKLFYHHYARPDRPVGFKYELRQDWNYLW